MSVMPASLITLHEWLTDVFQSQLLNRDLKKKSPRNFIRSPLEDFVFALVTLETRHLHWGRSNA